jgi:tRNA G18 (ribose-2'-O)-methylase SpoU
VSSPIDLIEDPADPRIAFYREARDGRVRDAGLFLVEGRLLVRRLLEGSRFTVRSLLATRPALDGLHDLLITRHSVSLYEAPAEIIRAVVGFKFHRGCLALGEEGPATAIDGILTPRGARLVLLLDDLADPDNVGAVFRNALAFGAAGILLSPGCADPLSRKAIRVSMGATLIVPFARIDRREGLPALRAAAYTVMALTPDPGAQPLDTVAPGGGVSRRIALLLGAEGSGLSEESRRAADLGVRIPMAAGVDSLNVGTASGIALHRLADRPRPDDVRSMMDRDPP